MAIFRRLSLCRMAVSFVAGNNSNDIVGQMVNADGTLDGAQFTINTVTTGSQRDVALALTADGRIVVTWQTSESGNNDIKAAIYDPREAGITLPAPY